MTNNTLTYDTSIYITIYIKILVHFIHEFLIFSSNIYTHIYLNFIKIHDMIYCVTEVT